MSDPYTEWWRGVDGTILLRETDGNYTGNHSVAVKVLWFVLKQKFRSRSRVVYKYGDVAHWSVQYKGKT